jgi:hypothetical protein
MVLARGSGEIPGASLKISPSGHEELNFFYTGVWITRKDFGGYSFWIIHHFDEGKPNALPAPVHPLARSILVGDDAHGAARPLGGS